MLLSFQSLLFGRVLICALEGIIDPGYASSAKLRPPARIEHSHSGERQRFCDVLRERYASEAYRAEYRAYYEQQYAARLAGSPLQTP